MEPNTVNLKVVLVGDTGVGKSSIVNRYVNDNFRPDEVATVGASYVSKIIQKDSNAIKFNIWDTAG